MEDFPPTNEERRDGSHRLSLFELAQIELRLARATPGPWRPHHDQVLARDDDVLADVCCSELEQSLADAYFISCAREDVARLTREVRQLWEELQALRDADCG